MLSDCFQNVPGMGSGRPGPLKEGGEGGEGGEGYQYSEEEYYNYYFYYYQQYIASYQQEVHHKHGRGTVQYIVPFYLFLMWVLHLHSVLYIIYYTL